MEKSHKLKTYQKLDLHNYNSLPKYLLVKNINYYARRILYTLW